MTIRNLSPCLSLAVAVLVIGLLLSSCNMPRPETPAPPPQPLPTATLMPCSLVAPDIPAQDSPIHETLRPMLTWFYEGTCPADGFSVQVAPGGDFDAPGTVSEETAPGTLNWAPDQDLLPTTFYAWRVAALLDGVPGPSSVTAFFWTGPTCDGTNLQAPILLIPENAAFISDPSPFFEWDYPHGSCLQANYALEVSANLDFSTDALHAGVGSGRSFETEVSFLEDCTQYYWRVKAVFGDDISGPYSEIATFYADLTASCGSHSGLPLIAGVVWNDVCQSSGPPGPVAPPGCVYREGGYGPDGIRQDDETPIAGLVVNYAKGGCPPTGPIHEAAVLTDEEGTYYQYVTPGTYCVWIDTAQEANTAILGRGRWTYPPGGYDSPVWHVLTLEWGDMQTDVDFGWYFIR